MIRSKVYGDVDITQHAIKIDNTQMITNMANAIKDVDTLSDEVINFVDAKREAGDTNSPIPKTNRPTRDQILPKRLQDYYFNF